MLAKSNGFIDNTIRYDMYAPSYVMGKVKML